MGSWTVGRGPWLIVAARLPLSQSTTQETGPALVARFLPGFAEIPSRKVRRKPNFRLTTTPRRNHPINLNLVLDRDSRASPVTTCIIVILSTTENLLDSVIITAFFDALYLIVVPGTE